ncbi:o-succinylbenzoate synthase [Nocardia sp. BMG111209]|uniref:o-succinylbenzoate synthase n=1 Tax=Nocardia sp. BMG111209 TaxID=1160137 RepID=UPI000367C8EF|nr:o-succinylbenzoate synthase [Nocardia sp. BMG111209]
MELEGAELRWLELPLREPFRTSMGTERHRWILLLRLMTPEAEGWGECVALPDPSYSAEYLDGAAEVVRRFLLPALAAHGDPEPADIAPVFARVRGNPMAKATVETALLDAWLRARNLSCATYLGGTRTVVASGVSIGIMDGIPALLDTVATHLGEGYRRIKLKIEPGWDVEPVRAVRERFGDDVLLQVDANAAYTLADADRLTVLDEFGLAMLEQPFAEEDIRDHAVLARRLRTPICLDESIVSARAAAAAIELGACAVVNIKPGRVGGLLESLRVHDVCVAAGIPAWCGGMLETGLGQAANLAVAALPGCTEPADITPSSRYYHRDVTEPIAMSDGYIRVPGGPGLGIEPLPDALAAATTGTEWIPLR